ncbi:MAG TPA: class I SAM-dependent methyltransferase, partial [Geobacteraceae bacterium]|nr:class I SAM-dependent methyltransferase [Geobacteraceae bacterium]
MRTSSAYESPLLRKVAGATIRPGGLTLTERGVAFCRFPSGARLLDVGCGAGATVEYLRSRYGFAAAGVDISRLLIAEGLVRDPALPLVEAEAEALPVEDGVLDGVLCECVLSLVGEPLRALREFRRVLRPGGHLILSDMYD